MKHITYICDPHKKETLLGLMKGAGIVRVLCNEVTGYDDAQPRGVSVRGESITINYWPRLKVEAVINDDKLPQVYEIADALGSGKLFVKTLDDVYSPRLKAKGADAV